MAARLRYTLVVRHPDSGIATAIIGGTEPPAWAEGQYDPADVEDDGRDESADQPDEGEKSEGPAGGSVPQTDETVQKPAGNASEDAWREYALANGKSEDDLKDLGRDKIRDLFA